MKLCSISRQRKILYNWPDEKIKQLFEILLEELENTKDIPNPKQYEVAQNRIKELQFLLYLRSFLKGELILHHRKLASIISELPDGLRLIKEHLSKIEINDPNFKTIMNCLSLVIPVRVIEKLYISKKGIDFNKTILHISDLHFGKNHKYFDESYEMLPVDERPTMISTILNDVFQMCEIDSLKIDYIIISGDITWDGDSQDFELGRNFLESLVSGTNVNLNNVILVPGNHDIQWYAEEKGKIRPEKDAELNYKNFFKILFPSKTSFDFLSDEIFDEEVIIIGLNSARLENKRRGIGFVGEKQLEFKLQKIKKLSNYKNRIKIAVLHHHLVPVKQIELIPKEFDSHISITLDSEFLIRELIKNDFKIVLHGHQHQPFFGIERRIFKDEKEFASREIAICGAGSLGVKKDYLNNFGRNQYNLIRITNKYFEVRSRILSSDGKNFEAHLGFQEWYT